MLVKCNVQESLRVNEHGVTVLTTSFNPFTFNTEGMQGAGRTYKVYADPQPRLGVARGRQGPQGDGRGRHASMPACR